MAGLSEGATLFANMILTMLNNQERRQEAAQHLILFEREELAWTHAFELLSSDMDSPQVKLFAAQTVKKKVTFFFHELATTEARESLRTTIVDLIVKYGPVKTVLTQLCWALAMVAVHMEEWTNPVDDTWTLFTENAATWPLASTCLPMFLELLPETLGDHRIPVASVRVTQLAAYVSSASTAALAMLDKLFTTVELDSEKAAVLRALAAWIRWGELKPTELLASPLIDTVFKVLGEGQLALMEEAAGVASELLNLVYEHPYDSIGLAQAALNAILPMQRNLEAALGGDEQVAMLYGKLFTDLGKATIFQCIVSRDASVFETLVQLAAVPLLEVAILPLGFVGLFTTELVRDEAAVELHTFDECYTQLLVVLAGQCARTGEADDGEALARYREEAHLVVVDIASVVPPNAIIGILRGLASAAIEAGEVLRIESVLYVLRSAVDAVRSIGDADCHALVESLVALPVQPELTNTVLEVLGALAKHLTRVPGDVIAAAGFAFEAVSHVDYAVAAAGAFMFLCSHEPAVLAPQYVPLVTHFNDVVMTTVGMPAEAQLSFISGCAAVAAAHAYDSIPDALEPLYSNVLAALASLSSTVLANPDAVAETWRTARHYVDLLKAMVVGAPLAPASRARGSPLVVFLEAAWETLMAALQAFSAVESFCEATVDGLLKHVFKALDKGGAPLLSMVVATLLELYAAMPYSCYLYLSNLLLGIFCGQPDTEVSVRALLEGLAGKSFEYFEAPNGFAEHPDLLMEFYEVVITVIRRVPRLVVGNAGFLDGLVRCALAGCMVEHFNASRSVVAFFEALLQTAAASERADVEVSKRLVEPLVDGEPVKRAFMDYGEGIVGALLALALDRFDTMRSELTAALNNFVTLMEREAVWRWLVAGLVNVAPGLLSDQNKEDFCNRLVGPYASGSIVETGAALRELFHLYRTRWLAANSNEQQQS